jgi:hypothetical protein
MKRQLTIASTLLVLISQVGFSDESNTTPETEEAKVSAETDDKNTSPEVEEGIVSSADVFSETKALESLLIIEGMGSLGSGFLTIINDRVFAVTNLHVLSGYGDPKSPNVSIKTVENIKLKIEKVFGAKDHDIALIQFSDSESYRDKALRFDGEIHKFVKTDDKVQIPGNSKGRGVILWTPGKIRGLGATEIEHTAPTYAGNSGSPVIHIDTNSAIGVHTYATRDVFENPFDKAARKNADSAITDDVRHFAFRLDTPKSWYQIDLREFQKQAERLNQWKLERHEAIGFIQSFIGMKSEFNWWDEDRLRGIATDFIEEVQKVSSGRREFVGSDEDYDYYNIYRTVLPSERERLRRKVIGKLHNFIALVDKKKTLKDGKIYPFLVPDYESEIDNSKWLTKYLQDKKDFLSE